MTRQERVDHSRRICRKITQKINGFSPRGLGHWRRTWDLVEAAAEGLLVAWEEAGDLFRLLEGSSSRGVANVV